MNELIELVDNLKKELDKKDEIIDIEQFSGHSHEYGGIQFTSTYIMWLGWRLS